MEAGAHAHAMPTLQVANLLLPWDGLSPAAPGEGGEGGEVRKKDKIRMTCGSHLLIQLVNYPRQLKTTFQTT